MKIFCPLDLPFWQRYCDITALIKQFDALFKFGVTLPLLARTAKASW